MSRCFSTKTAKSAKKRPPDTRKHTVLPVSIRLKSTEKTPACVSMRAFLQPISARIYFGKTASHRKRARLVQSRGASPQAYWMSVKAAQRRGCAKRAFCGVCFLMPGGLISGAYFAGLTIRFTSLFFTRMVLTTLMPSVAFLTLSDSIAAATTAASSLSTGTVTVPFSLPLTCTAIST